MTVQGAGPLDRPVRSAAARALHARTTPARHGRRESTLLDIRVRDTGEIGPDALTVTWEDGVVPSLMGEVAHALKLHRLEARLHNLLVYGPRQFQTPLAAEASRFVTEFDAALAELVRCWGPTWMKDLLAAWAQSSPRWDGYASYAQTERAAPLWPRPLPIFVRACAVDLPALAQWHRDPGSRRA